MSNNTTFRRDLIIKDTHRALWYEDGVLVKVLKAGRYEYPKAPLFGRSKQIEAVLVDMRERDMTIKGQEILTADKVAIRVSIIVRFRVVDAQAAIHAVDDYEARIYTDVQLAARRSLASMALEDILTNRNQLSDDILSEMKESAAGYGVEIGRADVKDLMFPGNLEQVMNYVLTAERTWEAKLIEARAKAEVDRIEAQTRAEAHRIEAEAGAAQTRLIAEAEAEAQRIKTQAENQGLAEREKAVALYKNNPALLRVLELEALREMAHTANARFYVGFGQDVKVDVKD
jgi:regulator of protease activity HflC (stomatin/prohibitin superfamily)